MENVGEMVAEEITTVFITLISGSYRFENEERIMHAVKNFELQMRVLRMMIR